MLIKRNKYFSAIEKEEYLNQKEFNSKAQKALRKKWEVKEGLKAAQADEFGASMATSRVNLAKGGNPILGINKPVSMEEMAVNMARGNNKSSGDLLKYKQEDLKSARRFNPKATIKDTMKDYEWESKISRMKLNKKDKEYVKAKALANKKKAETLKKAKTAGKVALGTAAVIGTGVVAKKLYDRKKKKNADQGNK